VSILAFDLGASSGRALTGRIAGRKLEIREIHRFPNDPVQVGGRLHWDILRLFHEIKTGMLKARHEGEGGLQSLAIDSWAVDFGLIGRNGELLGNPYHYRDHHTDGIMEELQETIGSEEIFTRTGIQFLPFNTIYQLYAMKKAASPLLESAQSLLMIPDLLRYFLTGEKHSEFTNATTTQLYNPLKQDWDRELLARLGLDDALFQEVLLAGAPAGTLLPSLGRELGLGAIPVTATAEHDTGAAVAAVPADSRDFAYLSCGTWSLMGTEVDEPVLGEQALAMNFTNEGGVGRTYRLLKNIMGLWIIQECRRVWEREGHSISFSGMVEMARQAKPFVSLIDPDHLMFLAPEHMPRQVQQYCRETGQPVPEDTASIVRCVFESLALKYRYVLECTEKLSGKSFGGLHMVGGGINNTLLCQFTANAIGRPVWAGPVEGSAIGNMLVQWISLGELRDIWEARKLVRESFPPVTYEPQEREAWEEAYGKFRRTTGV
jgi:rhamnulokinase